jgi:hypothetical protein
MFLLSPNSPEDFFASKLTNPGSVMRILSYPPQYGPVDLAEIGIGAHTFVLPAPASFLPNFPFLSFSSFSPFL